MSNPAPSRLDAQLRQRLHDTLGDRRVRQQDARAIARSGDHLVIGLALRGDELDPGRIEEPALDIEVRKTVIGKQDLGHESFVRWRGRRGRRRATAWPDGQWSSGLTHLVALGGGATPIIGGTCDASALNTGTPQ